jgi:hypothetical protein
VPQEQISRMRRISRVGRVRRMYLACDDTHPQPTPEIPRQLPNESRPIALLMVMMMVMMVMMMVTMVTTCTHMHAHTCT